MVRAVFLLTAAVAFASPAAAAECKLYGGIGNGVTEGMAKFMAEAAVKNVIENKGLKPTGEITHSCKAAMVGSECVARQQGCK
jgi:hypothetical protein